MSIGTFNSDEDDALFVVGNGYYNVLNGEEVRSNAMSVMRDGTIKIYDKLTNTSKTLTNIIDERAQNCMSTTVDNGVLM
jgi:hypothetical protein